MEKRCSAQMNMDKLQKCYLWKEQENKKIYIKKKKKPLGWKPKRVA